MKPYLYWFIPVLFLGIFFGLFSNSWDVGVLASTAIVITWYSVETRKMRIYSGIPGITFRWKRDNSGPWMLIFTNQGKGTALNISAEVDNPYYKIDLFGVNAMYQGDWHQAEILDKAGNHLSTQQLEALASDPLKITTRFGSMENPNQNLMTEIELRYPPISKITKNKWN